MKNDIRKFEVIGTRPVALALGIGDALAFHHGLAAKRKEARLIYLLDYWMNRLKQQDRIRWNTSQKPGMAACIA